MKVKAVWQFFEAERDGNAIHLFAPGARSRRCTRSGSAGSARRRPLPERLHSAMREDGQRDHLALFVVTAGAGIREKSEEMEAGGRVFQGARACRRWPSKPPRAARSGCTAASAKTGAFPIRRP